MRYGVCTVRHGDYSSLNCFSGCRNSEERRRDSICKAISGTFRFICLMALFMLLLMGAMAAMAYC